MYTLLKKHELKANKNKIVICSHQDTDGIAGGLIAYNMALKKRDRYGRGYDVYLMTDMSSQVKETTTMLKAAPFQFIENSKDSTKLQRFLGEGDIVIIVDRPLPTIERMELLKKFKVEVIYADHHNSAIAETENILKEVYGCGTQIKGCDSEILLLSNISINLNQNQSATENVLYLLNLLWNNTLERDNINTNIRKLAEAVTDWDIFRWTRDDRAHPQELALSLNALEKTLGFHVMADLLFDAISNEHDIFETKKDILDMCLNAFNLQLKNAVEFAKYKHMNFTFTPRNIDLSTSGKLIQATIIFGMEYKFQSLACRELLEDLNSDIIFIGDVNTGKFSIRVKDEIDINGAELALSISESFGYIGGGGGHEKASGCKITDHNIYYANMYCRLGTAIGEYFDTENPADMKSVVELTNWKDDNELELKAKFELVSKVL